MRYPHPEELPLLDTGELTKAGVRLCGASVDRAAVFLYLSTEADQINLQVYAPPYSASSGQSLGVSVIGEG